MARSYTPADSAPDIQVTGPNSTTDIQNVAGYTIPHGIYFLRRVPLTIFGTSTADAYVNELANAIEDRIASGLAETAAWREDVDLAGLLTDVVDFYVTVTGPPPISGTFTDVVSVPVNLLTADPAFVGDLVSPMFEDALAKLRQTAGL